MDNCKAWKHRPIIQKTWAQLKIDFSIYHNELRESQHTDNTSGFHGNNAEIIQQETATAISNLANATLADRETMSAMQGAITILNTQLTEANKLLMDNVYFIATLKTEASAYIANGTGGGGGRGGGNGERGHGGGGRGTDNDYIITFTHYCWTHGPKRSHTYQKCIMRVEGHKEEGTNANQLGGRAAKRKHYRV